MREFIEKKDNLIKTVTEFDRKLADFGESVKLDIKQSAMFFFYLYKVLIAPAAAEFSILQTSSKYIVRSLCRVVQSSFLLFWRLAEPAAERNCPFQHLEFPEGVHRIRFG